MSDVSSSSVSSEEEELEEEFIRQRRLHTRRGSMPEREIDCEDTETAELQSNLRRCQLASREGSDRSESESEDRRARRGGSNPEREIFTEDTETAEFQSNLRKLPTFSKSAGLISEQPDSQPEPEVEARARPVRTNKTVFRPAMRSQPSPAKHGLRRSRSWQGLTSGLRYSESVSDAGMPPPPPAPPDKR